MYAQTYLSYVCCHITTATDQIHDKHANKFYECVIHKVYFMNLVIIRVLRQTEILLKSNKFHIYNQTMNMFKMKINLCIVVRNNQIMT